MDPLVLNDGMRVRGGSIMAFVETVFLTAVPLFVAVVVILAVTLLKDYSF